MFPGGIERNTWHEMGSIKNLLTPSWNTLESNRKVSLRGPHVFEALQSCVKKFGTSFLLFHWKNLPKIDNNSL